MLEFHVAFLLIVVGTEAFFSALSLLNVRYGAETVAKRVEWVRDRLGIEDTERLLDYQRAGTGLSLLRSWTSLTFVLLVLYSGLFGDAVGWLESLSMPPSARGVVFFVALVVVTRIAGIPFSLYETFVVEEQFDFNQQSPTLWLRDLLVGTVVALATIALFGRWWT